MIHLTSRRVFQISGQDHRRFLQGIITADIQRLAEDRALYSCLLNPQGKILHDFFLYASGDHILLDVGEHQAESLVKKLRLYRLRAAVQIEPLEGWGVYAALSPSQPEVTAEIKVQDPRLAQMGWRLLSSAPLNAEGDEVSYHRHRIASILPEQEDYLENRAYPAEYGLEFLHAVSATKGCYVGQEVVARSRSRGTLHRLLHHVAAEADLPSAGTAIMLGEREVGTLTTAVQAEGLAVLRLDAVEKSQRGEGGLMLANGGEALPIKVRRPDWMTST